MSKVYEHFKDNITEAYLISDKAERNDKISEIKASALEKFLGQMWVGGMGCCVSQFSAPYMVIYI